MGSENYLPYTSFNFSGIKNPVFISPFLSSFSSSFENFTTARELKGGREIREEDKTKIGLSCCLLASPITVSFYNVPCWEISKQFFFINLFIFGCIGSSLQCTGFSLQWLLLLQSTGSRHAGFSSCGTWALEHRLSSCGTRA